MIRGSFDAKKVPPHTCLAASYGGRQLRGVDHFGNPKQVGVRPTIGEQDPACVVDERDVAQRIVEIAVAEVTDVALQTELTRPGPLEPYRPARIGDSPSGSPGAEWHGTG